MSTEYSVARGRKKPSTQAGTANIRQTCHCGDWGIEGTLPIVAVQNQKGGQSEFEWKVLRFTMMPRE